MALKQKAHSEVRGLRKLETGSQWRTEAVPEEGEGQTPVTIGSDDTNHNNHTHILFNPTMCEKRIEFFSQSCVSYQLCREEEAIFVLPYICLPR